MSCNHCQNGDTDLLITKIQKLVSVITRGVARVLQV